MMNENNSNKPLHERTPIDGCYPVTREEWRGKLREYKSGRATKDPKTSTGKMMGYDPSCGTCLYPVVIVEQLTSQEES